MEFPRLQRAVMPARINASTKLFAVTVLFASLAAGATAGMIQPRSIAVSHAMPAPDWTWYGGRVTHVDVAHDFTLSTHVRVASTSARYEPIMSNGEWMLGTRDGSFELIVFEQSGQTVRLANSTPITRDWMHVAITRKGSQISLWVDGNVTRMLHDAPTLEDERLAIAHVWKPALADVTIWNRVLGAAQLARLQ